MSSYAQDRILPPSPTVSIKAREKIIQPTINVARLKVSTSYAQKKNESMFIYGSTEKGQIT